VSDKKKVIEFKIEGDPDHGYGQGVYKLQFDFNALVRTETLTGLNLGSIQNMTAGQTRALVYASLAKHHPKVTLEDAGGLLTRAKSEVMDALGTLFDDSASDPGAISE